MKKKLCLIFGGASTEYEVSLRSAASVLKNVNTDKYDILPVGITKDGRWIYYAGGDLAAIEADRWQDCPENKPCHISPDSAVHGLVYGDGTVERIDVVFPVLHGKNGEDGAMQGLLQLAGIPYVGCGVAASANTMDKVITKLFAAREGVEQAKFLAFYAKDFLADAEKYASEAINTLGLPIFVKPARTGSSVGITKAKSAAALIEAVREASKFDNKILFEEFVDGQELETSALGRYDGRVDIAIVGEIRPGDEFYTYAAKYDDEGSLLIIPAEIPDEKAQELRRTAETVFRAMEGYGLSRIDFFLRRRDNKIVFNEINSIPGFTSISMYAQLFEASGVPYPELIDRLISLAFQRDA